MYNLKNKLKELMTPFRYEHSLLVAEEARKLAHIYNLDEDKAYLCGLLHDIAKDFSYSKTKHYIEKYNLNQDLLVETSLAHAEVGPLYIKENYQNIPSDVLQAIEYHTIGNENMTNFDKIIFLADKTGRKNKNEIMLKIQEVSYKDLDKAIIMYFQLLERNLKEKGKKLHRNSLKLLKRLNTNNSYK